MSIRGRLFLAVGLVVLCCGVLLGERSFAQIGAIVMLVPLISLVAAARHRGALTIERQVTPSELQAGASAQVRLVVHNSGRATGPLMFEDTLSHPLGSAPHVLLAGVGRGATETVSYDIAAPQRGKYWIGPLQLARPDALGMTNARWRITGRDSLLVLPHMEPLPRLSIVGAWAGSGADLVPDFSSGGAPATSIREYRQGDDHRRIHWRSTARAGQLMVREEEQPTQPRAVLLLDNRERLHTASSLEDAVSAAASIARHLAGRGFQVRMQTAQGEPVSGWHDGSAETDVRPHLEHLAMLRATTARHLPGDWADQAHVGASVFAVIAGIDEIDRDTLTGLARSTGQTRAVVVSDDPVPAAWLNHHGWRAISWRRPMALADAWRELAR